MITTYGIDRENFAGANAFYRHKEYVLAVGDVSEKERIRFYGSNEYHYKDGEMILCNDLSFDAVFGGKGW